MAEKMFPMTIGLVTGAILVLLLILVIRGMEDGGGSDSAQMTSYNVVRDDQGRIQSVDTLSGLPLEGQSANHGGFRGSAPEPRQAVSPGGGQPGPEMKN